ncbi:MAG: thioredoxin family protein [Gorillibacterium sp.]|nr:thioredoxin family protein [Gorillibacterium sp.]
MQQVKTEEQFRNILAESKPVVAVFKAIWCGDCHYIEPFLPELEIKYDESYTFIHIDRDDLPDLCAELNILGIPSFIVFVGGQDITRFVSKLRKTREEIEQFLDKSLLVVQTHRKGS